MFLYDPKSIIFVNLLFDTNLHHCQIYLLSHYGALFFEIMYYFSLLVQYFTRLTLLLHQKQCIQWKIQFNGSCFYYFNFLIKIFNIIVYYILNLGCIQNCLYTSVRTIDQFFLYSMLANYLFLMSTLHPIRLPSCICIINFYIFCTCHFYFFNPVHLSIELLI